MATTATSTFTQSALEGALGVSSPIWNNYSSFYLDKSKTGTGFDLYGYAINPITGKPETTATAIRTYDQSLGAAGYNQISGLYGSLTSSTPATTPSTTPTTDGLTMTTNPDGSITMADPNTQTANQTLLTQQEAQKPADLYPMYDNETVYTQDQIKADAGTLSTGGSAPSSSGQTNTFQPQQQQQPYQAGPMGSTINVNIPPAPTVSLPKAAAQTGLDVTGSNNTFNAIKKPRRGLLGNITTNGNISNALVQKPTLLGS